MDKRRTAIILAIIILPAILFTIYTVLITAAPRDAQIASDPEFRDFFSTGCPEGQFMVYDDVNMTGTPRCEPPRSCASDDECRYLDIYQLPTRIGACEKGACAATCGSGMSRPCK